MPWQKICFISVISCTRGGTCGSMSEMWGANPSWVHLVYLSLSSLPRLFCPIVHSTLGPFPLSLLTRYICLSLSFLPYLLKMVNKLWLQVWKNIRLFAICTVFSITKYSKLVRFYVSISLWGNKAQNYPLWKNYQSLSLGWFQLVWLMGKKQP